MQERITKEKLLLIKDFLQNHPETIAAYGYGSGVMPQSKNSSEKKEIDLILIVEDLLEYFHKNLEMNEQEFSKSSRKFFEKASLKDLEKGAPIAYISHINYKDELFKTGVISKERLISSCRERVSSYVPFRLEKPCAKIFCNDGEIENAILYDRQMTLLLCLLLLNNKESNLHDLFIKIASISYLGDFRVKIKCEDPNKVPKLVNNQLEYFIEDYSEVNKGYYSIENDRLVINYDAINRDLELLPPVIKNILSTSYIKEADLPIISQKLIKYYKHESEKEALKQAIKGIKTVGPEIAFNYALRKVKKGREKQKD